MGYGPSGARRGSPPKRRRARARAAAASPASPSRRRPRGRVLPAIASRYHAVLVEAAFERSVVEHGAPRGLQPDALRDVGIAGENVGGPPRESLLQGVAELRVKRRELFLLSQAHPVRR